MSNASRVFLQTFFRTHVKFFLKEIPLSEEEFKWGYKSAHSEWGCIRKDIDYGLNHYSLKPQTVEHLEKLFERAETYFYHILGYNGSYISAISSNQLRLIWSEIQKLAAVVLKENENFL